MTSAARLLLPLLALAALAALAAAAVGIVALGLATADGVTHLARSSYETEFVAAWSQLGWLLAGPVHVLARWRGWLALPAVVVAAVPQFVGRTRWCGATPRADGATGWRRSATSGRRR
jgi:hypothetical protein